MKTFISMPDNGVTKTFVTKNEYKKLEALGEVRRNTKETSLTKEEFIQSIGDAEVVVTGWGHCRIDSEMLKDAKNLKIIMHTGGTVGDLIDPSVYDNTNIKVISGNYYFAESVAEGVLAYALCALRKLDYFSANLNKGIWRTGESFTSEGLLDQKMGIVSLGAISKHLIKMAKPFRIDFRVYSTRPDPKLAEEYGFTYCDLESIFSECKIVSVHTALNKNTENMINKKHFKLLKDGAIFINTSRGKVICDEDLVEELKTNRIHAVLDVFPIEPLPADSPYIGLPNVTLYPHIAGPTPDRRPILTSFLIDDCAGYINNGNALKHEITKEVAMMMTKHG